MGAFRRYCKLPALFFLLLITQLPVYVNRFMRATLDPDIYWHLRVGDWILQHRTFPQTGIFSQYAQGHGWIAYSWGFEVLMAWLFRIAGLASLPIALGVLRAIIAFTILLVTLRISRRFWLAWLLTAASIVPLASIMVMRPILFTILFFTVELGLIFEARKTASAKPLYWLPLLFLVWSNIHIQFVYGLFLLALFAGSELLGHIMSGEKRSWMTRSPIDAQALRIALISLLSFAATFIGPYWGKVYLVILRYAGNTSQYNEISELVALSFRDPADYFVVILLMAACFAIGKKGIDLFTGSLVFSAAMVSFRSRRDEWFIVLVSAALIAESLAADAEEPAPSRTLRLQYAGTFVLALAAALGYAANAGLTPQNLISGIDTMYPVRATNYVLDHKLRGPMYNSFDWGGFLIFNLRDYPVSIDGRNDFYGPAILDRMDDTLAGVNWKSDPDLSKANFVLIEKSQPLAQILAADPDFRLAYSDELAVVLVRVKPVE
jgi:hypothetical protein